MIRTKIIPLIGAVSLLSGLFAVSGCGAPATNTTYSDQGTYFDTIIGVTVYDKKDAELIDGCFDLADHYEQLFSRTIDSSDVSRINAAGGEFVIVDEETIDIIQTGLSYCELSDGVFDLTVGALSDLWDITNNPGEIPNQKDIDFTTASIDYRNLVIDGNQVALKEPTAKLDLGAIAKGYIADRMKEYLIEHDCSCAMINLGGNVLVVGSKKDGSDFKIGIQKPFDKMNEAICAVAINDQTVVSSGNYERYFELGGKIYHHIMDTSTGYPVDNNLTNVSIITDLSVDGDALSTTCYSLGLEKGMELIESLDSTEAIFITDDMELHYSSGIEDKVTLP